MTIGVPMRGTRTSQNQQTIHPPSRSIDRSMSADLGMSKRVTATITFSSGSAQLQAANGTFAAFAAGDDIVVEGTTGSGTDCDGFYHVTGVDGTNQAYLVVDPAPKSAGPVAGVIVRTP